MSKPSRSTRLSATDWVDASLELITADGVSALRIARLCERLGVTKGSFYWHFDDIDALWEAMAERWRATNRQRHTELHGLSELPADQRLVELASLLMSNRHLTVETAIRDWARTNEKISQNVNLIDREMFAIIHSTLRELDVPDERAAALAGLLVYAGIGYIHGHEGLPSPTPKQLHDALTGLLPAATESRAATD
ncbi:TetR/AcrR family transcriptional regulator [Gordonia zhaorongruii]|uniref:TetR/AcrR family transcriptional regulator n=1 Tax=Gordonia zhaorongruii TaxID=2597659 RepID=UPI0010462087|nr:TetR/AcrR family transcriptional regulator [Gordonia zhaorongruii]